MRANRKPLLFLGLAICLTLLGLYRDEAVTVFTKASAICLECIGIG